MGKMLQNTFTNVTNEIISDSFRIGVFEAQINKIEKSKNILSRISEFDKNAPGECLEIYGDYVWKIARKFTKTTEEAETATQEIFQDIWKNAEFFDSAKSDERSFITHITLKRLFKNYRQEKLNL